MNENSNTIDRRTALKGIGAVAGSAALAGCTGVAGRSGEQLRYAQVLTPVSLDPIAVDDPWSGQVQSLVFEGLYTYDFGMNLVPVLANGKPKRSDDGKKYTVELRDEARFQNGTSVTAEDVTYSFEKPNQEETPPPTKWHVDMIRSMKTLGEKKVEFALENPYPGFEHTLTRPVVPKSIREEDPAAFGKKMTIGSGPYRIDRFKPGKYATLTSWKNHWRSQGEPIRRAKFVPNHAGLARTMSLKTGQNDIVERIQPKLWQTTKDFPDSTVVSAESYHYHFVGFNCSSGTPTAKPKVREGIDALLSMDELVKHLVEPAGRRQYGPLPRQVAKSWDMPLEEWKRIPKKKSHHEAKKLIKGEAGLKSWSPKIAVPGTKSSGDKMREKVAETIVHGLKKMGFRKARTVKYPWPKFRELVTNGDQGNYAMFVGSWAGYPDPDTFLYPLFHSNNEGLTNGTYYRDESVMKQIENARRTSNRGKRQRLYEESIRTILEERVHLPAYTLHNSFGVKNRVSGFRPHPISQVNPLLVSPDGSMSLDE
ncbi:ABC transporter substrate-binding protein [Haladaptatus caseinilyticus]|uniref:ABC transporter substrate-binding protein n=1 Tax=Haladaptatus caseinilyticus TaxID=2993314 RepID=UPI00224B38DB|nr:ABC transporter substrate-binding protein [Haladaptatus caseinilyticus]